MERESIVLLENRNNVLPLSKTIRSVALIGPQVNRVSVRVLHIDDFFAYRTILR